MKEFLDKYSQFIEGSLACFDRIVFKGYLPLTWPDAMEKLLYRNGLLIKDFGGFVEKQAQWFDPSVTEFNNVARPLTGLELG